jgi:hypothetical protein
MDRVVVISMAMVRLGGVLRWSGRWRFEVWERGVGAWSVLFSLGYIPWKRIPSYTLGDTTLTMRLRSRCGASLVPSQVEPRCSPEQRQALRHLLSQHVPETPADTFECRSVVLAYVLFTHLRT